MKNKIILGGLLTTLTIAGIAYASLGEDPRTPVDFYSGHTHEGGTTDGAPQHSGGTNKWGCHNASVPYHCH